MKKSCFLILLFIGISLSVHAQSIHVTDLTCEYLENPLGIDANVPTLGWKMQSQERGELQSAYEILVAANENDLQNEKKLLWKSGKVNSRKNVNIRYAGKKLKPDTRDYRKVRVDNQKNEVATWSLPAF